MQQYKWHGTIYFIQFSMLQLFHNKLRNFIFFSRELFRRYDSRNFHLCSIEQSKYVIYVRYIVKFKFK